MTFSALNTAASYATKNNPTFTGTVNWSGAVLNASSANVTTVQTTSSATYTDLATVGPSVTLTTGTKVLVSIGSMSCTDSAGQLVLTGFAVSGATTVAATDERAVGGVVSGVNAPQFRSGNSFIVTGLTAGSNTFTMKYRRDAGLATFSQRTISVIDLGS